MKSWNISLRRWNLEMCEPRVEIKWWKPWDVSMKLWENLVKHEEMHEYLWWSVNHECVWTLWKRECVWTLFRAKCVWNSHTYKCVWTLWKLFQSVYTLKCVKTKRGIHSKSFLHQFFCVVIWTMLCFLWKLMRSLYVSTKSEYLCTNISEICAQISLRLFLRITFLHQFFELCCVLVYAGLYVHECFVRFKCTNVSCTNISCKE